jgi:1-acyl-sn-glycerol-3-phosphate acyltransferase
VIPLAVNSAACWPKRPWIKRPGLITVSIGPPIASDGLSPDQLSTEVEHWIEAEMRRIDPDAYRHTQAVQGHEATA